MSDDFTLLCEEFGLSDNRRRGMLWLALSHARLIGMQEVCVLVRGIISEPHPVHKRPVTLKEIKSFVKYTQTRVMLDMQKPHDLPEKYRTDWVLHPEGANNGTGKTPAVCDRDESTAPESGGAEAGECGGCDDADSGH